MTKNMDSLICNKCSAPIYRGKQPYNIIHCGHIFCQNCLQHAEKQCTQCGCIGAVSIPLKEPLVPKVAPFFVPFANTLEMLLKVDIFRTNQMKITMQRFRELDKKYEMLKVQHWQMRNNMKILTEKYYHMKAEKEKFEKKLLFSEMHKNTPVSANVMKTPTDSGIFTHPSYKGYSSESTQGLRSINATPIRPSNPKKHHGISDGFRIPSNRKASRYVGPLSVSDTSSNYSFKR